MREVDANIVRNLRQIYGEPIAKFTDEAVLSTWWEFQGSVDYLVDKSLFPQWLEDIEP